MCIKRWTMAKVNWITVIVSFLALLVPVRAARQTPPVYIFVDGSKEMHKTGNAFETTLLMLADKLEQWQREFPDRDIDVPKIGVQGVGLVKKYNEPAILVTPHFYSSGSGRDFNDLRATDELHEDHWEQPAKDGWKQILNHVLKECRDDRIVLFFSNNPGALALEKVAEKRSNRFFLRIHLPDSNRATIAGLVRSAFTEVDSFIDENGPKECPPATLQVPTDVQFGGAVEFQCHLDGTLAGLAFRWELGDGATKDLKDFRYTYRKPGCYRVMLTIIDRDGTPCVYPSRDVTVHPKLRMKNVPSDVLADSEIEFEADAPGSLRMQWNFDDGRESAAETPKHSFHVPGKYQVIATGSFRCDLAATDKQTVTVHDVSFKADLPTAVDVGESVSFGYESDTARDPQWNFGDGTTSELDNPAHAFDRPGTYDVSLTVRFGAGLRKTIVHKIHGGEVQAQFEWSAPDPDKIWVRTDVTFTNTSRGFDPAQDQFTWDFGDGVTKSGLQYRDTLDYRYARPGTYTARLVVVRRGKSYDYPSIIKVYPEKIKRPVPPVARFETTVDGVASAEDGVVVDFRNTSTHYDPASSTWDFGDGSGGEQVLDPTHVYAKGAKYSVVLTVKSDVGTDSEETVISVPVAAFSYLPRGADQLRAPADVSFTDKSTNCIAIEWDFGDGSPPERVNLTDSRNGNVKHSFRRKGVFQVRLTAWADDASGHTDTSTTSFTIGGIPIEPMAAFSYKGETDPIEPNTSVTFTNGSKNYDSWEWDFGDGSDVDRIIRNPVHAYVEPGDYTVVLRINKGAATTSVKHAVSVPPGSDDIPPLVTFLIVIAILAGLGYGGAKLLGVVGGHKVEVTIYRGSEEVGTRVVTRSIRFDSFGSRPITMFIEYDSDTESVQLEFFTQRDGERIANTVTNRTIDLSPGVKSLPQPLGEYRIEGTDDRIKVEEPLDD